MTTQADNPPAQQLRRELGLFGAVMMGLGSIIGTGVFVSIGIAAGVAGPAVILAIALAAVVATCNALSSAQLAAHFPVSGGTYEYGYRVLRPWLGFSAGWMFLCAKSASAATAALGFAGYLVTAMNLPRDGWMIAIACLTAVLLTLIVLGGISRSSRTNILIVSITLLALGAFVIVGLPSVWNGGTSHLTPFLPERTGDRFGLPGLLRATALMFVAFTGYGRIATLGEEVHAPRRTIPRAIVVTLVVSAALYVAVGTVAVAAVGAGALAAATEQQAAPLEIVSRQFAWPGVAWIVLVGALTAMLGVLLNLILGLSRVLLAMGRRGDMPVAVGRLDAAGTTPGAAVIVVGLVTAGLTLLGSVKTTWSFSAFTVLIYYALTNLAALRLAPELRLYSPLFAWGGLIACLALAFWIEWPILLTGLAVLGVGLIWHLIRQSGTGARSAE